MTIDLATIDPATLQPSPELNELIAEEWMGWHEDEAWKPWPGGHLEKVWRYGEDEKRYSLSDWSPSTNPDHAGEARRAAKLSNVWHNSPLGIVRVRVWVDGLEIGNEIGNECRYSETNGDRGQAEALATCRAIVAALKAAEAAGKEGE